MGAERAALRIDGALNLTTITELPSEVVLSARRTESLRDGANQGRCESRSLSSIYLIINHLLTAKVILQVRSIKLRVTAKKMTEILITASDNLTLSLSLSLSPSLSLMSQIF